MISQLTIYSNSFLETMFIFIQVYIIQVYIMYVGCLVVCDTLGTVAHLLCIHVTCNYTTDSRCSYLQDNYTPLHIAVESCKPAVVETLLGYGADVHIRGNAHVRAASFRHYKYSTECSQSMSQPTIMLVTSYFRMFQEFVTVLWKYKEMLYNLQIWVFIVGIFRYKVLPKISFVVFKIYFIVCVSTFNSSVVVETRLKSKYIKP